MYERDEVRAEVERLTQERDAAMDALNKIRKIARDEDPDCDCLQCCEDPIRVVRNIAQDAILHSLEEKCDERA